MMYLLRHYTQFLQGNIYLELLRFFRLLTDYFYVSDPSKDENKHELYLYIQFVPRRKHVPRFKNHLI